MFNVISWVTLQTVKVAAFTSSIQLEKNWPVRSELGSDVPANSARKCLPAQEFAR